MTLKALYEALRLLLGSSPKSSQGPKSRCLLIDSVSTEHSKDPVFSKYYSGPCTDLEYYPETQSTPAPLSNPAHSSYTAFPQERTVALSYSEAPMNLKCNCGSEFTHTRSNDQWKVEFKGASVIFTPVCFGCSGTGVPPVLLPEV